MNKLQSNPRLPDVKDDKMYLRQLVQRLYELFRQISNAHNDSYYWETSGSVAPTTGSWADGDKCKNTSPSELGTAGSKYVITGWVYVSGNWLDMRTLTGN